MGLGESTNNGVHGIAGALFSALLCFFLFCMQVPDPLTGTTNVEFAITKPFHKVVLGIDVSSVFRNHFQHIPTLSTFVIKYDWCTQAVDSKCVDNFFSTTMTPCPMWHGRSLTFNRRENRESTSYNNVDPIFEYSNLGHKCLPFGRSIVDQKQHTQVDRSLWRKSTITPHELIKLQDQDFEESLKSDLPKTSTPPGYLFTSIVSHDQPNNHPLSTHLCVFINSSQHYARCLWFEGIAYACRYHDNRHAISHTNHSPNYTSQLTLHLLVHYQQSCSSAHSVQGALSRDALAFTSQTQLESTAYGILHMARGQTLSPMVCLPDTMITSVTNRRADAGNQPPHGEPAEEVVWFPQPYHTGTPHAWAPVAHTGPPANADTDGCFCNTPVTSSNPFASPKAGVASGPSAQAILP